MGEWEYQSQSRYQEISYKAINGWTGSQDSISWFLKELYNVQTVRVGKVCYGTLLGGLSGTKPCENRKQWIAKLSINILFFFHWRSGIMLYFAFQLLGLVWIVLHQWWWVMECSYWGLWGGGVACGRSLQCQGFGTASKYFITGKSVFSCFFVIYLYFTKERMLSQWL